MALCALEDVHGERPPKQAGPVEARDPRHELHGRHERIGRQGPAANVPRIERGYVPCSVKAHAQFAPSGCHDSEPGSRWRAVPRRAGPCSRSRGAGIHTRPNQGRRLGTCCPARLPEYRRERRHRLRASDGHQLGRRMHVPVQRLRPGLRQLPRVPTRPFERTLHASRSSWNARRVEGE